METDMFGDETFFGFLILTNAICCDDRVRTQYYGVDDILIEK